MKHIKNYERFFSNIKNIFNKSKQRKDAGSYYWTDDEKEKLSSLGFYIPDSFYSGALHYQTENPNTKEIIIEKRTIRVLSAIYPGSEDWFFYNAYITVSDDNIIYKDFDVFSELIDFVKMYITEEDIASKKYNL